MQGVFTKFLQLWIPDKTDKGSVVTDVFEPNFTKLDQYAENTNQSLANLSNTKLDKGTYPGDAGTLKTDIDKKEPLHNITTLTGGSVDFNSLNQGRYRVDNVSSLKYKWGVLDVDRTTNAVAEVFYPNLKGGAIGYKVGMDGAYRDWTYLDIPSGAENKQYIQDEGTKIAGNGYWDKSTNPSTLYYCLKNTTATALTSDFLNATNVKLRNILETLCDYTTYYGWRVWKYYDGTLILAFPVNFGAGETGERTLTFPMPFIELPMPSVSIDDKGVPNINLITGVRYLTEKDVKVYTNTGGVTVFVTLIGRWK